MRNLLAIFQGFALALRDPKARSLLLLSSILILCATVFYRHIEGWAWIDALYFSVVTLSTVGYGDFTPQTTIGKLFTICYLFCGVGLFVAAASAVAQSLIRARESERLALRRHLRIQGHKIAVTGAPDAAPVSVDPPKQD